MVNKQETRQEFINAVAKAMEEEANLSEGPAEMEKLLDKLLKNTQS